VTATAKAVEKDKNAQSVKYGGESAAWSTKGRGRKANNNYRYRDYCGKNRSGVLSHFSETRYTLQTRGECLSDSTVTQERDRKMHGQVTFHLDQSKLNVASFLTLDHQKTAIIVLELERAAGKDYSRLLSLLREPVSHCTTSS
jgi:hypothetical protein